LSDDFRDKAKGMDGTGDVLTGPVDGVDHIVYAKPLPEEVKELGATSLSLLTRDTQLAGHAVKAVKDRIHEGGWDRIFRRDAMRRTYPLGTFL